MCLLRYAKQYLRCEIEAVGTSERWPDDQARRLARSLESPGFDWLSFQTLWDEIVDSDPDLFN